MALFAVAYLLTFLFSADLSFVYLIAISVVSKITFVFGRFLDLLNFTALMYLLSCVLILHLIFFFLFFFLFSRCDRS